LYHFADVILDLCDGNIVTMGDRDVARKQLFERKYAARRQDSF